MTDFSVRPFAFMRLTHEALRAGFASVQALTASGDLDGASDAYLRFREVIAVHAKQEDERFFPLLDELFDRAVEQAGLRDTHHREDRHQERFEAALAARDATGMQAALDTWAPSFEAHLKNEEDLMMPLTSQVAPTQQGRAEAVRSLMEVDWAAMKEVQLAYVVERLAETKPYGPLRMFVAAVQLAAGDAYPELEPIVRDALPADKVEMLTAHGHLTPSSGHLPQAGADARPHGAT